MEFSKGEFEILKNQSLLNGFTNEEITRLSDLFEKKEYETNDIIIEEAENSSELYLITEGDVSVLKLDEDELFNIPIGKLEAGDMFGEMSFMDKSPRSSSVEATKKTVVYKLSREVLENRLPELQTIFNKLITNISIININRLRASNLSQVKTLRTSLRRFKLRQKWGYFLFLIIFAGGFLNVLDYFAKPLIHPDVFVVAYWCFYLAGVIGIIRSFHYYFDDFALNHANLNKTISESLIVIACSIPIFYMASFLFKPALSTPLTFMWIGGYLIYCLCFEFIGRGVFLTSVKNFLEDDQNKKSILLTACFLVFIPITSYVGRGNIFLFFIANVVLSFLFIRQTNLIGVTLIHFILGVYAKYLKLI